MRRSGFTLLELLVVVTILGLLTSVAVLRYGSAGGRARFEHSLSRLEALDARLRMHARRHGQAVQLEVPLRQEFVRRTDENGTREMPLGRGIEVDGFLSASRSTSAGRVTVDFAEDGSSETYALRVAGPADESVWLLFAGETGQVTRWEREADVEKILDTLRPDAD